MESIKNRIHQRFSLFCQQTTIHGWQYIDSEPGYLKKITWCLIVLICVGSAGFFMIANIDQYMNSTTVTTIESSTTPLNEIRFPSVYICNVNPYTRGPIVYFIEVRHSS